MKIQEHITIHDIDSTLTEGKMFVSRNWLVVQILFACALVLLCIPLIALLCLPPYDSDSVACMIGGSSVMLVCFVVLCILRALYLKGRRQLMLWLEDAVLLDAESRRISSGVAIRYPIFCLSTSAIQVSFHFNNTLVVKKSEYNGKALHLQTFNKFVDKKIRIAYSQKYDKVMLLKAE